MIFQCVTLPQLLYKVLGSANMIWLLIFFGLQKLAILGYEMWQSMVVGTFLLVLGGITDTKSLVSGITKNYVKNCLFNNFPDFKVPPPP